MKDMQSDIFFITTEEKHEQILELLVLYLVRDMSFNIVMPLLEILSSLTCYWWCFFGLNIQLYTFPTPKMTRNQSNHVPLRGADLHCMLWIYAATYLLLVTDIGWSNVF